ncbi:MULTISPECIES: MarR family transcriptional regulator [unclassified Stenotrophomonas]|uniref:MarR family winged helix-turn-helix transcriptional regulator n=1 Tax=unclassified Stenotrophomonas TaxID=196198 RepID=UPI002117F331|nr:MULTISPECIES: MarR family transcriptional regulator [unclassified Stenotrophomonas]
MDRPDPRNVPSFLIKRVARELTRMAETKLRPLDLGMASLPVLEALRQGKAATQSELARLLRVEQPSMAQTLARLERDQLILRSPDPHRPRAQRIELTPLALQRLPQAREILNEGNTRMLAGFSVDETMLLATFLQRLSANLDRDA